MAGTLSVAHRGIIVPVKDLVVVVVVLADAGQAAALQQEGEGEGGVGESVAASRDDPG